MADLLTHVLAAYVVLTPLTWRADWLSRHWVVVAMGGAAIPDLVKVDLLIDADAIERAFEIPFSYAPISSLGGVLVIAAAIAVAFGNRRRRAYAFLVFGGCLSLVGDGLRVFADGQSDFWLYPFLWWRPPTPSLYVTSDPRVTVVALVVATGVFLADRRLGAVEDARRGLLGN